MTAPVPAKDHLAPLDGLRGIAIALVVWFHVWQITWLPANLSLSGRTLNFNLFAETGFVGVSLFFFISGFCIFYPYARTIVDGAPLQTARTFFYRRMLKILPSYYLSLALMVGLGLVQFSSQGDELRKLALHAAFLIGIFPDTSSSINGVLWSLVVEVQFYVVFPLICWCALRRPLPTFAALVAIAMAFRLYAFTRPNVSDLIDQLPGTLDIFAAGMFTAFAYRWLAARKPAVAKRRWAWTGVALAGFGLAYWLLDTLFEVRGVEHWPMNWWPLGRPALDVAFVVATLGSLFALPAWQKVLANPVLVFLSLISYNLYLWHQTIAQKLRDAHVPGWTTNSEHDDQKWGLGFSIEAIAVAVLVSWAITAFVEQPLLRRKPFEALLTRRRAASAVQAPVAAALCVLFALLATPGGASELRRLPRPQHVVVIVEENKTLAQIVDGGSAPFIRGLAQRGALFTNAHGVTHPSLPNYFALFAGLTNTNGDGCPAEGISPAAPNLGSELLAGHLGFAGFAEGLPAAGSTVCTAGSYARKHAPWVAFDNIPKADSRPMTALPANYDALPTVAILIPNVDDDMHDGTIEEGDDWLRSHVAGLLAWADAHDTLVVLTWDEGFDDTNSIPTIFYGPMVKPGRYPEPITHYNTLRTLEDLYGLAHTGRAAAAAPIIDCWR